MDKKNQFQHHDIVYDKDKAFIDSIGDRVPTDEEWKECRRIWDRIFDRLLNLTLIAADERNQN